MADERVGIYLDLVGEDSAFRDVKQLERALNKISKTPYKIKLRNELDRARAEAADLANQLRNARLSGASKKDIKDLQVQTQNAKARVSELSRLMSNAKFNSQAMTTYFNRLKTNIVQAGARMQTLGKTLTSVTSPFTNMFTGMAYGAGFAALSKLTSGASGAFQRYDTMKTYSRVMSAMGYDAKTAEKSVEKLNEAVLGLPTGLDEIIEKQKMYTVSANDMVKGTQMAIAANNAVVAGGMDAVAQRRMELQLKRLLTTGELTSKQWNSLLDAAPLAFNAAVEKMGMTVDEFMTNADGEKFLEAFIDVGTTGKVYKATEEMKHTFSAAGANIENAVKRNVEGIIKSLDEVLIAATGKDVIDNIIDVKNAINDIGQSVRDWIAANPDRILEFFNNLKSLDIKGFLGGIATALMDTVDAFSKIAKFFSDTFGGANIGKFMIYGNILGRFLTTLGGSTKGLAGVGTALAKGIYKIGKGLGKGLGLIALPQFVKRLRGLSNAGKILPGVEKTANRMVKVGPKLKTGAKVFTAAGTSVASMGLTWQGVASKAVTFGGIALVAVALKPAAEAIATLGEVELNWSLVGKLGLLSAVLAGFSGLAAALGGALASNPLGWVTAAGGAIGIGAILGTATAMKQMAEAVATVAEVEIPSRLKVTRLVDNITGMLDAFSGMNATTDQVTSTSNLAAMMGKVKSIAESLKAIDEVEADFTALHSKIKNITQAAKDAYDEVKSDGGFWEAFNSFMDVWRTSSLDSIVTLIADMGYKVKRLSGQRLIHQEVVQAYATIRNVGYFMASLNDTLEEAFDSLIENHYVNNKQSYATYFMEAANDLTGVFESITQFGGALKSAAEAFTHTNITKYGALVERKMVAVKNAMSRIYSGMASLYTGSTSAGTGEKGYLLKKQGSLVPIDIGKSTFFNETQAGYADNIKGAADNLTEVIGSILAFANQLKSVAEQLSAVKITSYVDTINKKVAAFRNLDFSSLEGMSEAKAIEITVKARIKASVATKGAITHIANKVLELKNSFETNVDMSTIEAVIHVVFKADIPLETKQYVVNQAREAISWVKTQIQASYAWVTKTIYVQLVAQVNGASGVVSKVNTAISQTKANISPSGGVTPTYRARGGKIFRRRGTDSVPAMLTPGEWVNRTAAVKAYGEEFFKRINALDLDGALASIRRRPMGRASYVDSVVNRKVVNKTNNARVTQNFYHDSNPKYAFRVANRYVGAL